MRAVVKAREVVPLATSPEQLGGLRSIGSTDQGRALDAGLARQEEADRLGAPHRVAPGIVVIPTPQVRTGSRMIYARLGNDREYLFTGTIAPVRTNWAMLRLPAQLVTDLGRRKDRQAMLTWRLTIGALQQQAPGPIIVPANRMPSKSGLQQFFDESAAIHS